ncbi:methyltransferase domain-containing protein [bacterium]|nr:methyltransferase domain-containing protein [bacterium]
MLSQSEALLSSRDRLTAIAGGYRESLVIITSVEMGIFNAIGESDLDAVEISQTVGSDARATELLLNALTGMNLLAKEGDRFRLRQDAKDFLLPESENYLGDIFSHYLHMARGWIKLEDSVRSGKPVVQRKRSDERDDHDLRAFILGMQNISQVSAEEMADAIDLTGVKAILDVGGGPGTYLISLLNRLPQATGVLLDFERVLTIAEEQINEAGLSGRTELLAGDMFELELPKKYDLILLSNILHSHNERKNLRLVEKCVNSLTESGRLVIKEFFLDESHTSPKDAALFSLNMLLHADGGRSYSWNECISWMEQAGLTIVQKLKVGKSSGVLVGRKS